MNEQRLPYVRLSPDAIAAMQSLEHYLNVMSGLEKTLLELVRLRVSLLNGCEFCIGLHRYELQRIHEPESVIDAVARCRDSNAFTHRQRAALEWAEAITEIQTHRATDREYASLREHFSDKEIVDLTIAITSINAWNRLGIAFHSQWDPLKAGGNGHVAKMESNAAAIAAADEPGQILPSEEIS